MRTPIDDRTKNAALRLLRRGMVTQAEMADLLQVNRMTVCRWCAEAGIDTVQARAVMVCQSWERTSGIGR